MRFSGANLDHAKRYNRRVVLEVARLHGPLSRADITRATGLSPQTISNITDELCAAGLLRPVNVRPDKRGDPRVVFEINPGGGYTFGVSLDHRGVVVLLTDVAGNVVHRIERQLGSAEPEPVLSVIEEAVTAALRECRIARERVWGAGVVIPGLVQGGEFVALGPSFLQSWVGYPVAAELQRRLGMPVLTENDATAAAVGEHMYGAGRDLTDFVYLYFGVGLGAGLFVSGQPYRGGHGKSGEIGHMVVEAGGRPCQCGNRGCLERYASLSAAQAALSGHAEGEDAVDLDALASAYARGDSRMLDWIDDASMKLKQAIVGIENFLDPQTVILGGTIPEPLLDAIIKRLKPLPRSVSSDRPRLLERVIAAGTGIDTPALGAATLPIFDGTTPELSLLFKQDVIEPISTAI